MVDSFEASPHMTASDKGKSAAGAKSAPCARSATLTESTKRSESTALTESTARSGSAELAGMSLDELKNTMHDLGEKPFRAAQLFEWLHQKMVRDYSQMTNLSKSLREKLAQNFELKEPELLTRMESKDGSCKYLCRLKDGLLCETVGMPSLSSEHKLSVCISSQAGCAMGCAFCATGKLGLMRSLSAAELIDQLYLVSKDFDRRISHVVVMGQGEPFANYTELMKALRIMNSDKGLAIGARHITVSTCGIIPMIKRFAEEPEQFTLAVSLHSAVQSTRDLLMPGVRSYRLEKLKEAVVTYAELSGRRPSYEYALMKGVNDSQEQLEALIEFTEGSLCHVNLIQLNEIEDSEFKPVSMKRAEEFKAALQQHGVECSIRCSRGQDIDAACGQLASKHVKADQRL